MMKLWLKSFWNDEEGMGTLEILLIVAVLIAVALAFREYIIGWVEGLLTNIDKDMNTELPDIKGPDENNNN